jgi:predicted GNAT family N-acyltransferase
MEVHHPIAALLNRFDFSVAQQHEREELLALRAGLYQHELGYRGVDEYDESATHVIAKRGTQVVGAARIMGPNSPMEIQRAFDLGSVLAPGRRPAQVGGLFVIEAERSGSGAAVISIGLLKLIYLLAKSRGVTDLVMYTYEHLRKFYQRALFVDHGISFPHPTWGQVWFLRMDLIDIENRVQRSTGRLAEVIASPPGPNFHLFDQKP